MSEAGKQGQNPKGQSSRPREAFTPSWQPGQQPIVWSVAGFDPSSGAGITADLMTFAAAGLFGCSAITALTVQTTLGVFGSQPVSADLLASTLARLDEDLPPVGLKIGMLGTGEIAGVVAQFLARKRAEVQESPLVVLDPVIRSSSGRDLLDADGLTVLKRDLLPLVDWITPNWAELALLSGAAVVDLTTAESAGRELMHRYDGLRVVVTGGDQAEPLDLVMQPDAPTVRLGGEHVETTSTHGTGCAFSSAMLAALVRGAEPAEAARTAKAFVTEALRLAPGLGKGRGPMQLLWPLLRAAQGRP